MMKRKLILTGAALSLAVAMTGCGGKPVINQQPSSQEKNAVDTQAQTETTAPAADSATTQSSAAATAQTVTGTVDEETAQKIALEHAGVKATDATITKSKLDYEGRRQVYEIEWYAGGKKYDYEIAVDTGEILSSGYDEKHPDGVAAIAVMLLSVRQMRSRQHLAVSVVQRKRTSTNGNSIMTMDVRNTKARSSMAERNMTLRSMHPVELS